METAEIQRRLSELGYDIGRAGVDGIPGPATRAAIAKFQKDRGLDIKWPGTFGAKTEAALTGEAPPLVPAMPWYEEALRLKGVRETPGKATTPEIAKMLDKLDAPWDDDETAWCGTFVGWCFATTLPFEPLPANPFGARQWEKFGVPLKKPARGCVLTFWRGSPNGWQGHVGFYYAEDERYFYVLGGNQSNAVTVAKIDKQRCTSWRWPRTVDAPIGGQYWMTLGGPVSKNEA